MTLDFLFAFLKLQFLFMLLLLSEFLMCLFELDLAVNFLHFFSFFLLLLELLQHFLVLVHKFVFVVCCEFRSQKAGGTFELVDAVGYQLSLAAGIFKSLDAIVDRNVPLFVLRLFKWQPMLVWRKRQQQQ